MMRRVHPAIAALESTMRAWTDDKAQASIRARLCAVGLCNAGLLANAEIESGVVVVAEQERSK